MNAQLKPIAVMPVLPPKYDNSRVKVFVSWSAANDRKLRDYYVAIGGHLPDPANDGHIQADGDAHRYQHFVQAQWDRARGRFM